MWVRTCFQDGGAALPPLHPYALQGAEPEEVFGAGSLLLA